MTKRERPIVNEAQRLLVEAGVTLGQLASATGQTRQAASCWMAGKTRPGVAARKAIHAKWKDVSTDLWDVVPVDQRSSEELPSSPNGADETTFRERILEHAARIERELTEAKGKGRMQDFVKLMGLKQKVLMDGAKFTGELTAAEESRLTKSNRFVAIKTALAKALSPFPDAGKAVEEALRALDA